MNKIIFAKTRWQYDSYQDFYNLVTLSGFPICYTDEMDLPNPNHIYITCPMNGEIQSWNEPTRDSKRAKVYLWDLERPSGSNGLSNYINDNNKLISDRFLDRVIVSDYRLAKDTGFWYVPLGSHPELGHPGTVADKRYDIVHLMCYSNRRGSPWFKDPGVIRENIDGLTVAPNGWGVEKDKSLKAARFMCNVHQDGFLYIEPLRFALAAAYGLPIITENCLSLQPYNTSRAVFPVTLENMLPTIRLLLRNYTELYKGGWSLRERFTKQLTFRRCLEEYI